MNDGQHQVAISFFGIGIAILIIYEMMWRATMAHPLLHVGKESAVRRHGSSNVIPFRYRKSAKFP